MKDYYKILGVKSSVSIEEVKMVFRHLAQKYHPDKSGNPETAKQFIEVYEAYRVLSSSILRSKYDQAISTSSNADISNELGAIRVTGKDLADNPFKLYWAIIFIILMELMIWSRRLSLASLALTLIGVITTGRYFYSNVISDIWLGLGLTIIGLLLGYVAFQRLKEDYKAVLE